MFSKQLGLMLYVDDVAAERDFWQAVGFEILDYRQEMGFDNFDMKPAPDSNLTITVYDKVFIQQVSPEVASNVPSILFETDDIDQLQKRIASLTDTCSPVSDVPFKNFHFASPSGIYFAVKA